MDNMQRLGDVLAGRMKKTSDSSVKTTIELGVINRNLSLTTDSMRTPIPKGDYMVNLMLSGGSYNTSSESHSHTGGNHTHTGDDHTHTDGEHSHTGGNHSHNLPSVFRALRSGDRVLVAWCGNEPVVIAIVVGS